MQDLSLANLKIAGRVGNDVCALHMAVRKDLERLVPFLNQALEAMPLESRNRILDYWIPLPVEASPELELTRSEREWLLANPRIRLGWDPDWAPVEFLGEDGLPRGFSVDLMRRIQTLLGVRFVYEPPRPWADTLESVRRREIDMVSFVGPVAGRDHFLSLSEPYLSTPVVLYTRPNYPYIRDMADLRNRMVAVPAEYAEAIWIRNDYPGIRQLEVSGSRDGLRAVHEGRADAFAGSVMLGNYSLSRLRNLSLVISGETGYQNEMRIGVRSDWPVLAGILNKALDTVPESDLTAFYRKWVLLEYRHGVDYRLVAKVALLGILGVLLFVSWNRRLAREVRLRTAAEQAATQSRADIESSYQALKALERQKENLTHMIVHDLRNPLTVICGSLEMLRVSLEGCQGKVDECRNVVGMAFGSALEANRIVDTLLDVSRLEEGRMPLAMEDGELHAVAGQAVKGLAELASQSGIAVSLEGDTSPSRFDQELIRRVFANLVSNAIKACSSGARVRIVICRHGATMRAAVSDTGKGIAPCYHEMIFEKFSKAGDGRRQAASSGIGLAFCRLAVQAHGGRIGVESTLGKGSTFWFELPADGEGTGEIPQPSARQ